MLVLVFNNKYNGDSNNNNNNNKVGRSKFWALYKKVFFSH